MGMILTPYFWSMPSTEAITTLAQSVSGMKPILTSFFSGASEPAAHTPWWPSVENSAVAPAFWMKSRRFGCCGALGSAGSCSTPDLDEGKTKRRPSFICVQQTENGRRCPVQAPLGPGCRAAIGPAMA
jgi:hypothetical protein